MPKKNNPGCQCCEPDTCGSGQICVTVRASGCGSSGGGIAGATVTVLQGDATIGVCTTNSGGTCCVSIADAIDGGGTFTVVVDPPAGSCLNSKTTTGVNALCGSTTNLTVTLTVQSGCKCTACCRYPINKTLSLTDAGGSTPFTFTPPAELWTSCHMIDGKVCSTTTACGGRVLLLPIDGTTCVYYELECGSGYWTFRARWGYVEYWKSCTVNGDGSVSFSNPGYGYAVGSTSGDPCSCGYGSCSGFFDYHQVDQYATVEDGNLSISCSSGAFSGTATFPSTITSPGGLTIPAPHGGTIAFSL